jgi:hypothetical protein
VETDIAFDVARDRLVESEVSNNSFVATGQLKSSQRDFLKLTLVSATPPVVTLAPFSSQNAKYST